MNESFNLDQEPAVLILEPKRAAADLWRWVKAHSATLLCTVFIAVMSFNMLTVIARKSITLDETVMIPAAYYHLAAADFQLVYDHPPLSKILAAIPLLFIQPKELRPEDIDDPPYTVGAKYAYEGRFWLDNRDQFEAISFWSRVPMIALTAALGVLIFLFTRDLFGSRAAVLAVALFAFEPTILAHGRVVQTDVPAAFGLLFVCFALHRYLGARTWRSAVLLGIACGIALLSKFSTLIVGPVLLVVFLVLLWRAARRRDLLWHAAAVIVAAVLVIQAAYFFYSRSLENPDFLWIASAFPKHKDLVETTIRVFSYLLPTDFVMGAFWQLWHSKEGHPASLLGMYRQNGWWYYFPVAFALKTSLPFLLLSISSLPWATYGVVRKRSWPFIVLLIPFAVYTALVMVSPINIGIRYYLPAYTFLFILSGALLDNLLRTKARRQLAAMVAVVLLAWSTIEGVRAYPNYMSYMNPLAMSHPHWWYLSDSNVEWGDDIKPLAEYLHRQGETRLRSAVLGGFMILPFYGIDNYELSRTSGTAGPPTRYVAIGASYLNGSTVPGSPVDGTDNPNEKRVNRFAEYRHRTPEAVFGDSIYLYRVQD